MSSSSSSGPRDAVDRAIDAAVDAGDIGRAVALAHRALGSGIKTALVLNLAAFGEEQNGRFEPALGHLAEAERMAPGDVLILTAIGRCLSKQGRAALARTAFERALGVKSDHAPAHHGLGSSLGSLGEDEAAFASQKRASECDPDYPDPWGALAEMSLRRNDPSGARAYAERAILLDPFQPPANLVLATLDAEDGKRDAAIARLERLHAQGGLAPLHEAATQRLLADQFDAADRTDEAFRAYSAANSAMWRVFGADIDRTKAETGRALCRRLQVYFDSAPAEDWRPAPGRNETEASGHVFLLGFVRSGTTLLEQILASHSRIVALEEMPTLRALTPAYFGDNDGIDRLAALPAEEAERLRADYWARVRSFGVDAAGKIFVDKAPMSSIWQPMIAKLFPAARILFARRDSRDVVLSSFRHAFLVNALTASFTDLTETAHFYGEVMGLCETYREKLAVPTHIHRHEAMVADFDAETQKVCDFLGIVWEPAMREFAETAKRRNVRTPSAEQVRRGLNSSGVAQWRRYRAAMAPVLPILQPWIERFGYDAS